MKVTGKEGGHMLEEQIQPPGLEIPGEKELSGPCTTCCHSNGLVGLHRKTPLSIGLLLYVRPQRTETTAMDLDGNEGFLIDCGQRSYILKRPSL